MTTNSNGQLSANQRERGRLAARALRNLAASMEAQAEREDSAQMRNLYLADASGCHAAAGAWEADGEKEALAMIARWDTAPREEAMVALVRGGALTADAARLTETGRRQACEPQ